MSDGFLAQLLSVGGAAWAATTVFALLAIRVWSSVPQLLDKWLAFRTARAAEKAADWTRLRDEIQRLSEAERQCRHEVADLLKRMSELTAELADVRGQLAERVGYQIGEGKANQRAQVIESGRRVADDKEKKL